MWGVLKLVIDPCSLLFRFWKAFGTLWLVFSSWELLGHSFHLEMSGYSIIALSSMAWFFGHIYVMLHVVKPRDRSFGILISVGSDMCSNNILSFHVWEVKEPYHPFFHFKTLFSCYLVCLLVAMVATRGAMASFPLLACLANPNSRCHGIGKRCHGGSFTKYSPTWAMVLGAMMPGPSTMASSGGMLYSFWAPWHSAQLLLVFKLDYFKFFQTVFKP